MNCVKNYQCIHIPGAEDFDNLADAVYQELIEGFDPDENEGRPLNRNQLANLRHRAYQIAQERMLENDETEEIC